MKEKNKDIDLEIITPEANAADEPQEAAEPQKTGKKRAREEAKDTEPSDKPQKSHKAQKAQKTAEPADTDAPHEPTSLKEVLKEQAIEGEEPQSRTFSLRKILGGDILNTAIIRQQIWLFILIAVFMIIYVSNRYSCQQDILEIDRLQSKLQDAKYKALSSTSELTEKSRESNVLRVLKNNKDSALKMPNQAPYIINVPEEEMKK